MKSLIFLQPVPQAENGMSRRARDVPEEQHTHLVLPSGRLVRSFYRERLAEGKKGKALCFTFDQWVRHLLGAGECRLMSPLEQHSLVGQVMRQLIAEGKAEFFAGLPHASAVHALESKLGELKRSGVSPERLLRLWIGKPAKYRELARIYERYQQLLRERRVWDHEEPYWEVLRRLRQGGVLNLPKRVVLEHFHDLNPLQEQLLRELVTRVEIHFHVAFDETRSRLQAMVEPLLVRLRNHGFQERQVRRDPGGKERTAALQHLVENAFSPVAEVKALSGEVEVLAAPGVEAEVEVMVSRLKQWLEETGTDCSDVAVIVPDMDEYGPVLVRQMERAGLPFRTFMYRKWTETTLAQTIYAAFRWAMGEKEWGETLLADSAAPWIGRYGTEIRRLLMECGFPGTPDEVLAKLQRLRAERAPMAEEEERWAAAEAWLKWLASIPESLTWAEWVTWLKDWTKPLKQRGLWKEWARKSWRVREAAERMHAWIGLEKLLSVWETLGWPDERVERHRFVAEWLEAAKRLEIPTAENGRGIAILPAYEMRGDRFRAAVLMGCAEGKWPRPFEDDWLIPDKVRQELQEEAVWLETSAERRRKQLFSFFLSVSSATEWILFTFPNTDLEGKRQLRSPYLEECLAVLAGVKVEELDVPDGILISRWERCTRWSEGVLLAFDRLRTGEGDEEERKRAFALLHRGVEREPLRFTVLADKTKAEWYRRFRSGTPFDGVLRDERLLRHLNRDLSRRVWSTSSLQKLLTCRFHFMADVLWQVKEERPLAEGIGPVEEGDWIHEILCRFFRECLKRGWDVKQVEEGFPLFLQTADSVIESRLEAQGRSRFHVRVDKRQLLEKLERIWRHEVRWRRETGIGDPPAFLEISFGRELESGRLADGWTDSASLPESLTIHLGPDCSIRLSGKIDRVDRIDGDHYVVYDYKTGSVPKAKEILSGKKSLQLLLYVWALREGLGLEEDQVVGAAYYVPASPKNYSDGRNIGLWRKDWADRLGISKQAKGRLDESKWDEVEQAVKQLVTDHLKRAREGKFPASPTWDCPNFCEHRRVCRVLTKQVQNSGAAEEGGEG